MRQRGGELGRLGFHEVAQQLVYARDDPTFNESFAVVVEEEGVRRWLEAEARLSDLEAFRVSRARRRQFGQQVKEARSGRPASYGEKSVSTEKLSTRKRQEFDKPRADSPKQV